MRHGVLSTGIRLRQSTMRVASQLGNIFYSIIFFTNDNIERLHIDDFHGNLCRTSDYRHRCDYRLGNFGLAKSIDCSHVYSIIDYFNRTDH